MEILRVSSKTKANKLAGAIAAVVRDEGGVIVQSIGAGAVNQAVKAVAIARGFLAPQGIEICMLPGFNELNINDLERTAINMEVRRL